MGVIIHANWRLRDMNQRVSANREFQKRVSIHQSPHWINNRNPQTPKSGIMDRQRSGKRETQGIES